MAKRNQKRRRSKPPAKKLQSALPTKGNYYDLLEIFNMLNLWYFDNKIKARISWGRRPRSPQRSHKEFKMGLCSVKDRLITIHRALDRELVPLFVVANTIFHEMLHIKFPPRRKNGRRSVHYPEFQTAEKTFSEFEKAEKWERDNYDALAFF